MSARGEGRVCVSVDVVRADGTCVAVVVVAGGDVV